MRPLKEMSAALIALNEQYELEFEAMLNEADELEREALLSEFDYLIAKNERLLVCSTGFDNFAADEAQEYVLLRAYNRTLISLRKG